MSSWWLLALPLLPLPIGADRKVRRMPWLTYTLLAANILVYLVTLPERNPSIDLIYQQWGVVPNDLHPVTLITSTFLHTRFTHLFVNMLFLWVFGPLVEDAVGPIAFLILYFGGGAASGLLHTRITLLLAAHSPIYADTGSDPLVGASGAISAIFAPFAIRYYRSEIRLVWLPAIVLRRRFRDGLELPAVYVIISLLIWNLGGAIYGLLRPESGGVAFWAHLGGFAFGYAVAGVTGLFLAGAREYLLDDARTAAKRGVPGYPIAVRKYQAFLHLQPANVPVRLEYIAVLADMARSTGSESTAAQTRGELQSLLRKSLEAADLKLVVEIVALATRSGFPVDIPSRERLRVATTAQELGYRATAIRILETIVDNNPPPARTIDLTPTTSDDEIARLKLGQLLIDVDPPRAAAVLDGLIHRYPDSDWIRMARQLRSLVKSQ